MSKRKRFLMLGSILLLAAGLFTFSPFNTSKASAATINGCPPTQSENSSNNAQWVQVIQYTLNSLEGFDWGSHSGDPFSFPNSPLATDGGFGPKTDAAVVSFQNYMGIQNNGVVGDQTWAALGFCYQQGLTIRHQLFSNTNETYCPPTLTPGSSSGVWVQALQDLLNIDYVYVPNYLTSPEGWTPYLASDGGFGPQTSAATYDWQYVMHLQTNSQVGPHTWTSLFMCYD